MRRPPLLPTLVVLTATVTMVALGVWQLRRAAWKEALLAQYHANAALPALDLDPLLARGDAAGAPLAFRRVLVTCHARNIAPASHGGRSLRGEGGYSYVIPCRPGARGLAGRIMVNVGWTALPMHDARLDADGLVAGRFGAAEPGAPLVITSASAQPPLAPSAPASIDRVPNNHMMYAVQWFIFAALAIFIYVLALRRRRRRLPPGR